MKHSHLVGLIADTHDHRPAIQKAVALFNERGVKLVLHAGDFVAPFTAKDFGKLDSAFIGVFGNNDGERAGLRKAFGEIGEIYAGVQRFQYESRKFVLMHEPSCIEALVHSGDFDVILYGHTHEPEIREGETLVINPGEACGWVSGRRTVAILDLDGMKVENVEL
ncbi:MAG: YfcE family phosphodiesterase [Candidatus Latescibacterota bacterium]|nr:MAG: YfcE family phosphodiesterase [Candidatus Latescibacteria bacterium 4484_107]RKY72507.1 MAG: YfcE family phosphodiesterase [Candidatus Latescibacterota bacterium]